MAILEKLSKEELEKVTGGEIVEINEDYYILVDDRYYGRYAGVAPTLEGAKKMAKRNGLSQEVISPEEYEKRYRQKLHY